MQPGASGRVAARARGARRVCGRRRDPHRRRAPARAPSWRAAQRGSTSRLEAPAGARAMLLGGAPLAGRLPDLVEFCRQLARAHRRRQQALAASSSSRRFPAKPSSSPCRRSARSARSRPQPRSAGLGQEASVGRRCGAYCTTTSTRKLRAAAASFAADPPIGQLQRVAARRAGDEIKRHRAAGAHQRSAGRDSACTAVGRPATAPPRRRVRSPTDSRSPDWCRP